MPVEKSVMTASGSCRRCELERIIWEMQVTIVKMKVKYSFLQLRLT